ncbi:MAG: DUF483 domain-containing protein [Nanoarchaeota archaeon]|nr:DUF483 domain-containing protein [Nanoarchaeota archaeon]
MKDLIQTFGSKTKVREILYLLKDLKPVVRQGFYPHELEKVKQFCEKNNLFLELSPYKILMEGSNYSDKGTRMSKDHSQGMFFVYISKNQKQALLANLHETKQDHYNLGLALGYPECCAKFYQEQFKKGNLAPEHQNYHPLIDIRKRKTDQAIISHFPCSPNCQKSIQLALSLDSEL